MLIDTRKFAGCRRIEVYLDQGNPNRMLLWEGWDSRAHHEKYVQWQVETGMIEALVPMLSEPPAFLHLDHTGL